MSPAKRKRHRHPAVPVPDAASLLQRAAEALNACREAGLDLKVRHGVIECPEGLLLPLSDGTIVARTRQYTEFPVSGDED